VGQGRSGRFKKQVALTRMMGLTLTGLQAAFAKRGKPE